ncbi:UDP-galactopyranose mutase [Variovorax sp.]|uniref:UDP-galactopyranose mutase n=1 Tax=Variovorax sp. TaxID=1871043 RepID=UPI002D6791FE|nr:UDP-galactopyranose mutase [Variovorax sp.]HYP85290.1 UDP-galactopyranose mutase [Variovorax sp.]
MDAATVVGAGFAGSVVARELADAGYKVLVVDKRSHIGGNAYDCVDRHGVLIHQYGPHIFHTNSARVLRWLSRFTDWRFYEHRVLAKVGEKLLPIPINRTTINQLYELDLDEAGVEEFIEARRESREIKSSLDVVLNSVGADLCSKFFEGYTRKQWGIELSELAPGVAARIPTRTNDDDRYFTDTYQVMPAAGYTSMFGRMLDHENITVRLQTDFKSLDAAERVGKLVYTGPIDEYFGHRHGPLPYRSLRFEHRHYPDAELTQPVGTVNYPNDHDYTRITEFKHLTGQVAKGSSVVFEHPQADGEPFYPIPRPDNQLLYEKYAALAEKEADVFFVGRLAQYRYYNMDQVVAAALTTAQTILGRR